MADACAHGIPKEQELKKFRADGYDLSQDPDQWWPMELQLCENVEMNGVEFNTFRMVDLRFRHTPGFPLLEVHRILFVNEQNRHPNVWSCYTGKLAPSEVSSVIADPMSPAFTPIVNSPCSTLPTVLKQGGFKDGEGHVLRDNSDYVFWRYVELHILGLEPWWKQRLDCMSFNLSTLHNIEKGSPRHSILQMCHTIRSGKPESQLVAMQIICWHKNGTIESTRTEAMIFAAGFQ